ncbi:enterobactin transporter EntS [Crossiella cryophila]|uniref:ENTS family enterobactin (Siderophore) exporter n=1 Tax=Crossiella cryophila TaxID=43355 RepID=A0A7W7CA34_9PSEU|nr:enterobactin transporter EntS [Crossiella cryophila]MBB4677323.1 ENTS family enterobactin (siderophore) exporter [Crossiella cryophila]
MRLGQFVMDTAPLRSSPPFRLVFAVQVIAMVGTNLTVVAANLQVFAITRSSLQVGLVSLALGVALLFGLLVGGVLADRASKRLIIVTTRLGMVVVLGVLAWNSSLDSPSLALIYATAIPAGLINGLGAPALIAATPALVGPENLAAAGALTAVTTQIGAMIGPLLAGFIAESWGLAVCFTIDAATFLLGAVLLAFLPKLEPEGSVEHEHPVRSIVEGFAFLRRSRVVTGLLLIDVCAMVFAMPYVLFPEMGVAVFGGEFATGLLYAAPAVGAFLAALTSGWTATVARSGLVLIGSVLLWGLAVIGFGLSPALWLALLFLAVAGAADTISEILRRTLLQHHTPERLLGRVGSMWLAQATTGTSAGNAVMGGLSRLLGSGMALVAGGAVCVLGVVGIAIALPELRKATLSGPSADEQERVTQGCKVSFT